MRIGFADVLEACMWGTCCLLLAFFIASGAWLFAAGLLSGLALGVGALYAYRGLVIGLMLGMPSLFVLVDKALKARGVPIVTADRALMAFLVTVLVLWVVMGRMRVPPLSQIEKWMLVLLGVVFVSYLSTVPRKSGPDLYQGLVLYLEGYLTPFTGYLLARSLSWSGRQIRSVLWLLGLLGIYLVVVGVLQYVFGVLYFSPTYLGVGLETDRATGGFGSPLEYGQVMASMLLLYLLLYTWTEDAMARVALLGMALGAAGAVLLSLTRAQWLAACVALAYVFWRDPRVRRILATGALAAGAVAAAVLPLVIRWETFLQRVTDLTPIYSRLALWSTAGNMIVHNPVFGVGFGYRTFNDFKREYLIAFGPSALGEYALAPGVPHNEFLHVLATMGIVGFTAYILVYYDAWGLTRRCERTPQVVGEARAQLAVYVQATILVFVVSGMFAEMWTFTYFSTLLFFLLGLLASPDELRTAGATPARPLRHA